MTETRMKVWVCCGYNEILKKYGSFAVCKSKALAEKAVENSKYALDDWKIFEYEICEDEEDIKVAGSI